MIGSAVASGAMLVLLACSHANGGASGPPTPEDYCRSTCTPVKGHPCGSPDDSACVSECLSHIEGHTDACRDCILQISGWRGNTCTCDKVLGNLGSITCTSCDWNGNTHGCSTDFSSCSADMTCTGFVVHQATDHECAARCGVVPISDGGGG